MGDTDYLGLAREAFRKANGGQESPGKGTGTARRPRKPRKPTPVPLAGGEPPADPHRLACVFLNAYWHQDGPTLRYWRGQFHRWQGGAYRPLEDGELRADVTARVKAEFDRLHEGAMRARENSGQHDEPPPVRPVTKSLVSNVIQALGGEVLLGATRRNPPGSAALANTRREKS
jgi:hypothetical protein